MGVRGEGLPHPSTDHALTLGRGGIPLPPSPRTRTGTPESAQLTGTRQAAGVVSRGPRGLQRSGLGPAALGGQRSTFASPVLFFILSFLGSGAHTPLCSAPTRGPVFRDPTPGGWRGTFATAGWPNPARPRRRKNPRPCLRIQSSAVREGRGLGGAGLVRGSFHSGMERRNEGEGSTQDLSEDPAASSGGHRNAGPPGPRTHLCLLGVPQSGPEGPLLGLPQPAVAVGEDGENLLMGPEALRGGRGWRGQRKEI